MSSVELRLKKEEDRCVKLCDIVIINTVGAIFSFTVSNSFLKRAESVIAVTRIGRNIDSCRMSYNLLVSYC